MTHASRQAEENKYQAAKGIHCVGQLPVCSDIYSASLLLYSLFRELHFSASLYPELLNRYGQ